MRNETFLSQQSMSVWDPGDGCMTVMGHSMGHQVSQWVTGQWLGQSGLTDLHPVWPQFNSCGLWQISAQLPDVTSHLLIITTNTWDHIPHQQLGHVLANLNPKVSVFFFFVKDITYLTIFIYWYVYKYSHQHSIHEYVLIQQGQVQMWVWKGVLKLCKILH